MAQTGAPSALGGLRVLDVCTDLGLYCTKLLADLGADVVLVEPPGGHPARRLGPFFRNQEHPERSLSFFYLNTNKRSVTLDLETPDGCALLADLAQRADILVESLPPGALAKLGLDYTSLSRRNPRLILTSISPYGQDGPWRDAPACDLTLMASGGLLSLAGWPDSPPDWNPYHLAHKVAGIHACVATLTALYWRDLTGAGGWLDVSAQAAVALGTGYLPAWWELRRMVSQRMGPNMSDVDPPEQWVWPCKDGFIVGPPFGGQRGWEPVLAWMKEDGATEGLDGPAWQDPAYRRQHTQEVAAAWGRFLLQHTKAELYHRLQRQDLAITPMQTMEEVVNDPQLAYRQFFVPMEHPELGAALRYPAGPFPLSETPLRLVHRAPLIGEHTEEVLCGELGLAPERVASLRAAGVI
ncbi:MAG: CoA transferase [Chloroflexi bacterium]|nr:CoA transferase [Chloroflexota bacterium]